MCLYLKDKLPCSGSTLVTQNNMNKTVVKGSKVTGAKKRGAASQHRSKASPVRHPMALRVRKKSGKGSKVTGAKKRVAASQLRSTDGKALLITTDKKAQKRTVEVTAPTLPPVSVPKRPRLGRRVLSEDSFGLETFLSVQQCLETLSQRLSMGKEDMQIFIAHRVAGSISDFDCPGLVSEFPGDVIDCSTQPVTILLTESEQGVRLVALVVKENHLPVRVLPTLPKILERNITPRNRRCGYIKDGEEGRCHCNEGSGYTYSFGCAWSIYGSPKTCKFSKSPPGTLSRQKLLSALPNANSDDLDIIGRSSVKLSHGKLYFSSFRTNTAQMVQGSWRTYEEVNSRCIREDEQQDLMHQVH